MHGFTDFEMKTKKLFVATNGFAKTLLNEEVQPARAQVLSTKPIKGLPIKGTFHLDQGYYYFRNIDNRILLGGGRNLDFKTEETLTFGQTDLVQNELERLLAEVILPRMDLLKKLSKISPNLLKQEYAFHLNQLLGKFDQQINILKQHMVSCLAGAHGRRWCRCWCWWQHWWGSQQWQQWQR